MTEQKTKFINFWRVEEMIDRRINVLENTAIEKEGKVAFNIDHVIQMFQGLKNDLNIEWHEEIEEYFEE